MSAESQLFGLFWFFVLAFFVYRVSLLSVWLDCIALSAAMKKKKHNVALPAFSVKEGSSDGLWQMMLLFMQEKMMMKTSDRLAFLFLFLS